VLLNIGCENLNDNVAVVLNILELPLS